MADISRPIISSPTSHDDSDRGRSLNRHLPSRWGPVNKLGLPETLNLDNLTNDQVALFTVHVRIDEIGRLLRDPALYIPPTPERSPSPEPFYGADGKRVNTRDYRYRKKLEDERHKLVSMATAIDPKYRPPTDYRRPTRLTEKIYIPVRELPNINFIGLLLGPRGSTLKQMEADSGAKIAIRGKGSVKEGKGAPTSYQNQEEDLHCLITADTEAKVRAGMDLVNRIIETASTVPESQNDLKRQQLRDLAALNGTLRDDENQVCQNCGAVGHKRFNCPERTNFTNAIICRICGNAGHFARDCMVRNNPELWAEAQEKDAQLDQEYAQLMEQLGAGPGSGGGNRDGGDGGTRGSSPGPAPWQRGGAGGGRGLVFGGNSEPNSAGPGPAPWARGSDSQLGDRTSGLDSSSIPPLSDGVSGLDDSAASSLPPWAASAQINTVDSHQQPQSQPQSQPQPYTADCTTATNPYAGMAAGYPAVAAPGSQMTPEMAAYWQQYYYAYYAQQQQQPPQ